MGPFCFFFENRRKKLAVRATNSCEMMGTAADLQFAVPRFLR